MRFVHSSTRDAFHEESFSRRLGVPGIRSQHLAARGSRGGGRFRRRHYQAIPSSALPFIAIKPCRLADTRDGTFPSGYGPPSLSSGVVRVFTFAGRCGIPSAIDAISANLTVANTQGARFIVTFPTGSAQPSPLVSSLNYSGANQVVANSAVIPVLAT